MCLSLCLIKSFYSETSLFFVYKNKYLRIQLYFFGEIGFRSGKFSKDYFVTWSYLLEWTQEKFDYINRFRIFNINALCFWFLLLLEAIGSNTCSLLNCKDYWKHPNQDVSRAVSLVTSLARLNFEKDNFLVDKTDTRCSTEAEQTW